MQAGKRPYSSIKKEYLSQKSTVLCGIALLTNYLSIIAIWTVDGIQKCFQGLKLFSKMQRDSEEWMTDLL